MAAAPRGRVDLYFFYSKLDGIGLGCSSLFFLSCLFSECCCLSCLFLAGGFSSSSNQRCSLSLSSSSSSSSYLPTRFIYAVAVLPSAAARPRYDFVFSISLVLLFFLLFFMFSSRSLIPPPSFPVCVPSFLGQLVGRLVSRLVSGVF